MRYVTVTLMTFNKQFNGRRMEVKSYSCNHRLTEEVNLKTVYTVWSA